MEGARITLVLLGNARKAIARHRLSVALFFVNLGVLCIAYCVYLAMPHYSCDTYAALSPHDLATVNLSHARFMHYILYTALEAVGCDLPQHLRITQCIMTAVCAFGTSMIAKRFFDALRSDDVFHLVLLDALSILIIANPYYLSGWYYWPESCVGASMGMLTVFLALMAWCSPKKNWKRRLTSLVLVVLAANMYQIYLEFFLGVALAYSLLEHAYKARLSTVLDLFCTTLWCGIAGVSTIVSFNVLESLGVEMSRSFSESVGLWARLRNTAMTQTDIMVSGYGMFPKGYLIVCIGLFIAAALVVIARRRTAVKLSIADVVLALMAFLLAYASNFAPEFATMNTPVPRIFVGVFTLPLFAGSFFAFVSRGSRRGTLMGGCAAIALLCVSIYCLIAIESGTIRCNAYDDAQLNVMCDALIEYEEDSGRTVNQILYGYDPAGDELVPGVNPVYDVNKRGMRTPWFFRWMIKERLGEKGNQIEVDSLTEDEQRKLFGDTDWHWFEPAEQIMFDGSTMYVVMY